MIAHPPDVLARLAFRLGWIPATLSVAVANDPLFALRMLGWLATPRAKAN